MSSLRIAALLLGAAALTLPAAAQSGSGKGAYTVLKKHATQAEPPQPPPAPPPAEAPAPAAPTPQPDQQPVPTLPPSVIPSDRTSTQPAPEQPAAPPSGPNPGSADSGGSGDLVRSVLEQRHGAERVANLLKQIQDASGPDHGLGSSNASVRFDNAPPSPETDSSRPAGTNFFSGNASYHLMPVETAQETVRRYGGIPGGVVLEGEGPDLDDVGEVGYDSRYNALVLDQRRVYVLKVAPKLAAAICRAVGADDKRRVGVSAAAPPIVYGAMPDDSPVAWDLLLADEFLGDIVFGRHEYTKGYRFAQGYVPAPDHEYAHNLAVFFTFTGFQFTTDGGEMHGTNGELQIQLVPLSNQVGNDGNFLPDEAAIRENSMSEAYAANAGHVADNIAYYRREAIVEHTFAYGETAALFRALKRADFNLDALAGAIDPSP